MQTFKKLGCTMERGAGKTGDWAVSGKGLPQVTGQGNKGVVMAEALRQWEEAGLIKLENGEWRRV